MITKKEELKSIPNPTQEYYEIEINCPELTFVGVKEQPDFGTLRIVYVPDKTVIELKSLKYYIVSLRDSLVSYERLINTIYEDLMEVYEPTHLYIEMNLNPRGNITSTLRLDSYWRKENDKI